jgi:hypothetical protein
LKFDLKYALGFFHALIAVGSIPVLWFVPLYLQGIELAAGLLPLLLVTRLRGPTCSNCFIIAKLGGLLTASLFG